MRAKLNALGGAGVVLIAAACSSASGGSAIPHGSGGSGSGSGGGGNGTGTGGFGATGSGGSGTGGFGAIGNSGGTGAVDQDAACTSTAEETKAGLQPADIIWIIDNSGSMTEEIPAVQSNMDAFSKQIIQSGVDVHVILIVGYPGLISLGLGICMPPPLGKMGGCPSSAAGSDNNLPQFFHDPGPFGGVQSHDGLDLLVSLYPHYKPLLRATATHWVAVVTDDDESGKYGPPGGADLFINDYKNLAPLADFKMSGITSQSNCPNAAAVGTVWQSIITKTGGLNADICNCAPGNVAGCQQTIQGIFSQLADKIIQGSKPLDCHWPIPQPPPGETLDPGKVNVQFTDNGATNDLYHVNDASACDPQQGGWYYDDNNNPTQVISCDASCNVIKAATDAKISVLFGCGTHQLPH